MHQRILNKCTLKKVNFTFQRWMKLQRENRESVKMQNITFPPPLFFFLLQGSELQAWAFINKSQAYNNDSWVLGKYWHHTYQCLWKVTEHYTSKISKPDNIKWSVLNATKAICTLADISLHSRCGRSSGVRSPSSKKVPFAFASSVLFTFLVQKTRQDFSQHILVSHPVLSSVQNHDWESKT